jgi:RyR domain
MIYQPVPVGTSAITLTAEIRELTELLAANTHEVWARRRLSEGWRYEPERNDAKKEHAGPVRYQDLSESEKEYDRHTAVETLKVSLCLGYRVEKAHEET